MESTTDLIDRWVCPDDRQLALRGRLDIGWSTFPENVYKRSYMPSISDTEQEKIIKVLRKASEVEGREQERIGYLVDKVSNLRASTVGDGEMTCLVCGAKKGSLKPCSVCSKGVCSKCNMENLYTNGEKTIYCIICWEERELWKKSGAWFFKAMPDYMTSDQRMANMTAKGHHTSIASTSSCPRGSLAPRDSLTPSIRRPSFLIEDEDVEDDDEESDDDISSTRHAPLTSVASKTTGDFNLGIDVNGTNQIEEKKEKVTKPDRLSSQSSVNESATIPPPPGISITPDTPLDFQPSFMDSFDKTDGRESTGSLSPQFRPRSGANSADNKKKLALKFRKKKARSESPSNSHRSDSVSQQEDVDEIFKNYENQNGKQESNSKSEFFGDLGILEFTLQYDSNTLELLIIVHCGKGLRAMDHGKTSDPYVKTHLLPDSSKSTKKRTQTVHKNLNPLFNETLVYHGVTDKDISHKVLRLSVMDENKLSSNALIGETCVSLKGLMNRPVQQFRKFLELQSEGLLEDQINTSPGRIEVALHYLTKKQQLVVGIIRCAELKAMDPNGYSDPYVKCYLKPDSARKTKKKTAVKKKTLNPDFNEEFTYDIAHNELAKKSLYIAVWDHDVGTRNDFIGAVSLGINSSGEALKHWFETLQTSDRRVTRWHILSSKLPSGMDDDE